MFLVCRSRISRSMRLIATLVCLVTAENFNFRLGSVLYNETVSTTSSVNKISKIQKTGFGFRKYECSFAEYRWRKCPYQDYRPMTRFCVFESSKVNISKSWEGAKNFCSNQSSVLIKLIKRGLDTKNSYIAKHDHWLGALRVDDCKEDNCAPIYKWTDGTPLSLQDSNWGRPPDGYKKCVYRIGKILKTDDCDVKKFFYCIKPQREGRKTTFAHNYETEIEFPDKPVNEILSVGRSYTIKCSGFRKNSNHICLFLDSFDVRVTKRNNIICFEIFNRKYSAHTYQRHQGKCAEKELIYGTFVVRDSMVKNGLRPTCCFASFSRGGAVQRVQHSCTELRKFSVRYMPQKPTVLIEPIGLLDMGASIVGTCKAHVGEGTVGALAYISRYEERSWMVHANFVKTITNLTQISSLVSVYVLELEGFPSRNSTYVSTGRSITIHFELEKVVEEDHGAYFACFSFPASVDILKDNSSINPDLTAFTPEIQINFPPQIPETVNVSSEASGTIYGEDNFNATCTSVVGTGGKLNWLIIVYEEFFVCVHRLGPEPFTHLQGIKVTFKNVPPEGLVYLGPRVQSTLSMVVNSTINNAYIECHPKFRDLNSPVSYAFDGLFSSTERLTVKYRPKSPNLTVKYLIVQHKGHIEANCSGPVGSKGRMTLYFVEPVNITQAFTFLPSDNFTSFRKYAGQLSHFTVTSDVAQGPVINVSLLLKTTHGQRSGKVICCFYNHSENLVDKLDTEDTCMPRAEVEIVYKVHPAAPIRSKKPGVFDLSDLALVLFFIFIAVLPVILYVGPKPTEASGPAPEYKRRNSVRREQFSLNLYADTSTLDKLLLFDVYVERLSMGSSFRKSVKSFNFTQDPILFEAIKAVYPEVTDETTLPIAVDSEENKAVKKETSAISIGSRNDQDLEKAEVPETNDADRTLLETISLNKFITF